MRLTKQTGKLGHLKTIPFPCLGFGNDRLIKETRGGGGERYVSFREDGRKQRNEGSLILGSRTTRFDPLPGIKPTPPALEVEVLTTDHQGSPLEWGCLPLTEKEPLSMDCVGLDSEAVGGDQEEQKAVFFLLKIFHVDHF